MNRTAKNKYILKGRGKKVFCKVNLLKGSESVGSAVDEAEKIVADYLSAPPKNTKRKRKMRAPLFLGSAVFLIAAAFYLLIKSL